MGCMFEASSKQRLHIGRQPAHPLAALVAAPPLVALPHAARDRRLVLLVHQVGHRVGAVRRLAERGHLVAAREPGVDRAREARRAPFC